MLPQMPICPPKSVLDDLLHLGQIGLGRRVEPVLFAVVAHVEHRLGHDESALARELLPNHVADRPPIRPSSNVETKSKGMTIFRVSAAKAGEQRASTRRKLQIANGKLQMAIGQSPSEEG